MQGYRKLPYSRTWLLWLVYGLLAVGFLYVDTNKMLQLVLGMVVLYALSFQHKQPSNKASYVVLCLFIFVLELEIDTYLSTLPPLLVLALTWIVVPMLIDAGFQLWQRWHAQRVARRFLQYPPDSITISFYFDQLHCMVLAFLCGLFWVPMLTKLLDYVTTTRDFPWSVILLWLVGLPLWKAYLNQLKLDLFLQEQGQEHIRIDATGIYWQHLIDDPAYLISEQLAWPHIGYIWIEKATHPFEFDTVIVRAKSDLPDDVPFTQIDISQAGPFVNAELLHRYLHQQQQYWAHTSGL